MYSIPDAATSGPRPCADIRYRYGGTNTFIVECSEGPHWGRPAFPMPFGRHRDRPLGELDDGYLRRLRDECSAPRIAVRARQVLLARRAGR